MAADKWAEIEARFDKAQRTGEWLNEERVIQEARQVDPALAERLRARQLYAPIETSQAVAA